MNKANINSMIIINNAQELVISFDPASGASVTSKKEHHQSDYHLITASRREHVVVITERGRGGGGGEALSMRTIWISVLRRSSYKT